MDYSAIPGFLQREKSTSGEDKLRVKPSHESIKQVEKFMQKFKERRAKNKAEAKEDDNEEGHVEEAPHEEEKLDDVVQHEEEESPKVETEPEVAKEPEAPIEAEVKETLPYVLSREELSHCKPAHIAMKKSVKVLLKQGETYYYCTCGKSKNQPFCDGSHKEEGCEYKPLKFTHEGADEKRSICACKRNKVESGPFCDATHKSLPVDW